MQSNTSSCVASDGRIARDRYERIRLPGRCSVYGVFSTILFLALLLSSAALVSAEGVDHSQSSVPSDPIGSPAAGSASHAYGPDDERILEEALAEARRGEYARAVERLGAIIDGLDAAVPDELVARALLARGEIGMLNAASGGRTQARADLLAAHGLSERCDLESLALAALAELNRIEGQSAAAVEAEQRAIVLAESCDLGHATERVRVNAARAALQAGDLEGAFEQARAALERLGQPGSLEGGPGSLMSFDAPQADTIDRLHLAETLGALARQVADPERSADARIAAFEQYRRVVESEGASRTRRSSALARAYLGMGTLYLDEARDIEARQAVERAALIAQDVGDLEILQLAEHQLARVLVRLGDFVSAEAAYGRSLEQVEALRPKRRMSFESQDVSFREGRGSLYYEYVSLLLRERPKSRSAQATEAMSEPSGNAVRARAIVERLKAEEIRDYYGDECVDFARGPVRAIDALAGRETLIVYPIALADRIELLVTRRGKIERYRMPVPRTEVAEATRKFRRALENAPSRAYLRPAAQLYDWLVRPYESLLDATVKTIVFVPDASFRTIPMAALYDGERFLIERVATPTAPGISLVDPGPVDLDASRVLAAGVSESVDGLPELPHVPAELEQVRHHFGAKVLLDSAFTASTLQGEVDRAHWNILHLATHAEFGEKGSDSFLLTHDGRIEMQRFDELISKFELRERPLDLLTLSACETAAGSERAALGLSGAAVQSGARSVLGTLWAVNDDATARLIDSFYSRLAIPGTSRAEAIQGAQRVLLSEGPHRHPAYWAGFLLINNWM